MWSKAAKVARVVDRSAIELRQERCSAARQCVGAKRCSSCDKTPTGGAVGDKRWSIAPRSNCVRKDAALHACVLALKAARLATRLRPAERSATKVVDRSAIELRQERCSAARLCVGAKRCSPCAKTPTGGAVGDKRWSIAPRSNCARKDAALHACVLALNAARPATRLRPAERSATKGGQSLRDRTAPGKMQRCTPVRWR